MNTLIVRRMLALLILFTVSWSLVACQASTANIANAELARGYNDGKATDVTSTFAPSDTPLHLVVTLNNAPDDTTVKTIWTAVDVNDGQIKNQKLDETVLTSGSGVLDFTLTNEQAWPKGTYKVDVMLNDKPDRTVEFHIQ